MLDELRERDSFTRGFVDENGHFVETCVPDHEVPEPEEEKNVYECVSSFDMWPRRISMRYTPKLDKIHYVSAKTILFRTFYSGHRR
ncbi:MAG TPA: hypothetical protein PLN69_05805 [bacterium]|nr:hypothetical protein [bacterium]